MPVDEFEQYRRKAAPAPADEFDQYKRPAAPAAAGAPQGFLPALWQDVKGLVPQSAGDYAKSLVNLSLPGSMTAYDLAQSYASGDQQRQQAGHSLGYRVLAPAGAAATGVNLAGMEGAAEAGDTGGVLGHTVLPTAMALTPVAHDLGAPVVRTLAKEVNPATLTGRAMRRLGGGAAADRMEKPSTPAEAAGGVTNAEVNNFAKSQGIDLLPGQVTESRPVQAIQAVGERAITPSGEQLQAAREGQVAQLHKSIRDFKDSVAPAAGPDATGRLLKSQVEAREGQLRATYKAEFEKFRQSAGDIPVDMTDASQNLRGRLEDFGLQMGEIPQTLREAYEPPQREASSLVGLGGEPLVTEKPAQIDMARAQTLRSNALDLARTSPDGRIRAFSRGVAEDIDTAMEQAADKAGATATWRNANAVYKNYARTFTERKAPLYNLLNQPDPAKAMQSFVAAGNIGGSLENLRAASSQGIPTSALKRAVLENIESKSFRIDKGGKTIGGYSPEFLGKLFTPAELRRIQLTSQVARKIGYEMNPSGTSNVMTAKEQLGDIFSASVRSLTAPAAARLTLSPGFRRGVLGQR